MLPLFKKSCSYSRFFSLRRLCTDAQSPIAILGAGQMGAGIALVAAKSKLHVTLTDQSDEILNSSMNNIKRFVARDVDKGRCTDAEASDILSRISLGNSLEAIQKCNPGFVIEAATENLDLKLSLFRQLDKLTNENTILATNTSSISITKIAAATTRPERVIGMHFFNPVPIMKLVEIITGLETSDDTLTRTTNLAKIMGKVTTQSKDMPGFIANRVLMPYINEAFMVLGEGTATKENIDTTMKLGTNVPMGPLTLADFIGLDTCLAIMEVLHTGFGDSKYRPAPLLRRYVEAGRYGRKTKYGVYDYN